MRSSAARGMRIAHRRTRDRGLRADHRRRRVDRRHTAPGRRSAAVADPRVRVVHHPLNRKLGGSIKTGFAAAKGDLVLYSDADLPFDMDELRKGLPCHASLRGRHRAAPTGSIARARDTSARCIRPSTTASFAWLFGLRIRDVNFAFKLCRGRVLDVCQLEVRGQLYRR